MANKILSLENISVVFDGFKALTDVNINVMENTIHFFIGPNGAGKTTLLDIICGKTKPTNGKVKYFPGGKEITLTGMKEYLIVGLGIGRKFQVPSVFTNLTVYENMELSLKNGKGVISSIFSKPTEEEKERIDEILDMVDLLDKKEYKGINLAHGEKQWLEIAMLLVQKPKVILLDEPVAGMGKPETYKTGEILKQIKNECTVVIVEHDMEFVKMIADMVTVMHEGKVLMEGDIDSILGDETVQKVYLGRGGERNAED